jgi:DNA-directed RNA polymerase specialized sigma24 family protein
MTSGEAPHLRDEESSFAQALAQTEEPLRRALVAAYGLEVGVETAADARRWAWEHREKWLAMENPAGYLFRVGQSAARQYRREPVILPPAGVSGDGMPIAPELPAALASLSARQRAAVILVHAHGYPLTEAAAILGLSVSTLRNHLERGLRGLRRLLEETGDA